MIKPELIDFVKKEIEAGVPIEIISNKLKTQGLNEKDIAEVFSMNISPIQPVKNKKLLKFILIILVTIILLGATSFAYGLGYFTDSNKLFSQIVDSSKNKTSFSYDFNFNLDASNIKTTIDSDSFMLDKFKIITFGMQGSSDFSDKENLKLKSSVLFKSSDIEAGIDFRIINQSIYFNLTKAPDLGFFSLKPLENKWIVSLIKDDFVDQMGNPLVSISPVNPNLFSDFTDEQKKEISSIVNKAKFIKITNKYLPVLIDGSISYHFDFEIDKEGTISFLKNITEYVNELNKNNKELIEIEEIDYNEAFSAIKNFHGEAWVGIFDKLPHKILINADVVNPKKVDDGVMKFTMSMLYKDWGKPVSVEVPDDAVTIKELMSIMLGDTFSSDIPDFDETKDPIVDYDPLSAEEKVNDATIKAILESILQSSVIYSSKNNNSYKGFCSFKGLNGAYSLAIKLPKNSLYKCNDSDKEWASWVKISTGDKFCVDSTSYHGLLKNTEKSTTCLQ
jgi:hypothetical protein